ncbi:hypothetical protein K469DRAFT_750735 [Zopfia rhizophila CBS 207.26]|uniref:TPR-like protein n=1 Tax=Zopfia rhizophila CBS 207.26 TaxID=1314779 RepID=A0A6A6E4W1_9PEZI|nr:hypothetical protein K469DRAFT_750735 [Zopfia rhizophila CBS 207.26]
MEDDSGVDIFLLQSSSDRAVLISPSEFSSPDQLALLQHPAKCDTLSIIYHKEFYRTEARSHLDNAIFCARKVVEICPPENPLRKKYLLRLGNYLSSRYDRYTRGREQTDLDEAVQSLQGGLRVDGDDGDLVGYERAKALTTFARCHRLRFLVTGSQDDFDSTLEDCKSALAIYNEIKDDEKIARTEHMVAILYEDSFEKTKGSTESLDRAVEWAQRAVDSSEGLGFWNTCMKTLAGIYERRYPVSLNPDDLHAAIGCWELMIAQGSDRLRATYQFELGRVYYQLTKITESFDHGSEASSNIRRALQNTPSSDPARPGREKLFEECFDFLSNSVGFDIRDRATNAEVKAKTREISLASRQDPAHQAELLTELSLMYYGRYESGEATRDAVAAKDTLKEAIELTPDGDDENLASRLRLIAFICDQLYWEKDNPEYLDEGVLAAREAVGVCEQSRKIENSFKALVLHTSARVLSAKDAEDDYEDGTMISDAVRYAERAVELMSEYCNANDDCAHCKDKQMYLADLESFRRTKRAVGV